MPQRKLWFCFLKAITEQQNPRAKCRVAPVSRLFDEAGFAPDVLLCISVLGINTLVVI